MRRYPPCHRRRSPCLPPCMPRCWGASTGSALRPRLWRRSAPPSGATFPMSCWQRPRRSPSPNCKRRCAAHPQTPGYLQRVKTRPSPAIFCCGRTPPFSIRGLPQLSRSARSVTFALEPFAHRLTVSTDRLGPLAHSSLRWFFVGATPLHLAKGALTLIDVVVADIDQHRIVTPFLMTT